MQDYSLHKIEILIQQKRFTEAEKILKDLLSSNANNIHFLSLLAEVNLQQDKFDEANNLINNAIALSPGNAYLFYIKSRIALHQDKYDDAEKHISHAIALDPLNANYFALMANLKLSRKQYAEALKFADKALEQDPENLLGLNTRSMALLKLNKKEESFKTIEGALREDPNNAYTHANYGWGLLEKGDHKKALEHFKEALQNEPNFAYARAGMSEALKAGNPVYRLFLKYAFFMGNLTSKYQWFVIIGFYIAMRGLNTLADNSETLRPYLFPLIIALTLFAFSTWVINPISNLFLRFNKYGKFLLSKKQKMSSNFVACSFAAFIAGVLLYFIMKDEKFLTIAVFGFAMMVPFGVMFSPTKNKHALVIYALAMSVAGLTAIALTFATNNIYNAATVVFLLGFIAYQWIANFMLIKQGNR